MVAVRVASGADDWIWDSTTSFDSTAVSANLGNPFSVTGGNLTGYRWLLTGPASGDTINSAIITFACRAGRTDDVNLLYDGCAADSPAAPTTYAQANGLARTTAQVTQTWTTDTVTSSNYDTPDLKTIVQEIINRAGWASGNAIILFIRDNASTAGLYQQMSTYDNNGVSAPLLTVTYTPASGGLPFELQFDLMHGTMSEISGGLQ